MAFTYQTVVDLARKSLNDEDKVRYSDSDLLLFANHGMLALVKRRPDFFIGQFANLPTGESGLTEYLQIDPVHAQTLADWVVARAEMTDDEHANSGRAGAVFNLFGNEAS